MGGLLYIGFQILPIKYYTKVGVQEACVSHLLVASYHALSTAMYCFCCHAKRATDTMSAPPSNKGSYFRDSRISTT